MAAVAVAPAARRLAWGSAALVHTPQGVQYTQGMPYLALGATVTEPPFTVPIEGADADELAEGVAAGPPRPDGKAVELPLRMTWTCPAATELLAVAVTPKYLAICAAFPAVPVP
jgi:hypothetical protein